MNRRDILRLAAATGASSAVAASRLATPASTNPLPIIDTNVSLFHWPFRRLPLDETKALVTKLRSLGITSAWAGSFEALLHRDIRSVNERLVNECSRYEQLKPVGSINLMLPGWESDLRRCLDKHTIKVLRLLPNYHGYKLDNPRFHSLLKQAAAAACTVQIAVAMEDTRTQHERVRVPDVDLAPLADAMSRAKSVRVQLLNYRPRGPLLEGLAKTPGLFFDTARVDGTDGVPKLVREIPGRVLFGSHAPFLLPEAALIRVHESDQLNVETLRRVYAQNAAVLLAPKA